MLFYSTVLKTQKSVLFFLSPLHFPLFSLPPFPLFPFYILINKKKEDRKKENSFPEPLQHF